MWEGPGISLHEDQLHSSTTQQKPPPGVDKDSAYLLISSLFLFLLPLLTQHLFTKHLLCTLFIVLELLRKQENISIVQGEI